MYNYKYIEEFITKVQKEAEIEAQKVFDRYEKELEERVLNQLKKGDKLVIGMGTAFIQNSKGEDIAEKLALELSQTQYWSKNIEAGFSLRDITK